MIFSLTDSDRILLREIQQNERHKKNYVKVTVLLGLDKGKSPQDLSDLLGIDESTVYRYVLYFREQGLDDYLENHYFGFWGKLDSFQLAALQTELQTNFYTDSQAIADWILSAFGVSYTAEGLVPLLHRLGFCYKKTKQVPCEAELEKQVEFVAKFEDLLANLSPQEAIFFIDAVHPQHNTRSTYGWIAKGETKEVLSVSGRKRVNLNGAVNVQAPEEVLVVEADSINAQSTWALYQKIEDAHPEKEKIYTIGDNARYYKNKELQEKLQNSRIVQIFLPPYSPNLNLIERLWKFMRKKVIDNNFTRNFEDFKAKLLEFFQHIDQYKNELETLLTPKFHLPKSQTNFY
jgi:transposase